MQKLPVYGYAIYAAGRKSAARQNQSCAGCGAAAYEIPGQPGVVKRYAYSRTWRKILYPKNSANGYWQPRQQMAGKPGGRKDQGKEDGERVRIMAVQ